MEPPRHDWSIPPAEAIAVQKALAGSVRCVDDLGPVRTIAGVDVSMNRFSPVGFAAIVVLSVPDMRVLEVAGAKATIPMPYIPGLLSFREIPLVLEAWERLTTKPDLLMVDGQGIAHPRGLGVAAHLGVTLDVPAIGCAKSILVGRHAPLAPERGSREPLVYKGETVGWAVRTKNKVNPVFVSCGHRVSQETAVRWVLECARGYRLPEPTRQAHLASNALRREGEPNGAVIGDFA
jgi:deoxyribonuclease V